MILNVPLIAGTEYPTTTVRSFSLPYGSDYRSVTSVIQFSQPGVYLLFAPGYSVRSASSTSTLASTVFKSSESNCVITNHGQSLTEVIVPTTQDTVSVHSSRPSTSNSIVVRLLVAGPGTVSVSSTYSTSY